MINDNTKEKLENNVKDIASLLNLNINTSKDASVQKTSITDLLENNVKDIASLLNLNINTSKDASVQKTSITDSHNTPIQKIFYGVPGCGKSYKIKEILESQSFTNKEYQVSRVVFHPEYTNADFIGQILPGYFDGKETIDYRFSPGPFSQILRRAYLHPDMPFFLIIEEINRGNAAAIFGDIFQLLDRHGKVDSDTINNNTYGEGWSSYSINNDFINWNIRKDADKEGEVFQEIPVYKGLKFQNETKDKKYKSIDIDGIHFSENTGIRLPPNLSLLATMNTSDQNVFTLDNAFQRRWDFVKDFIDSFGEDYFNIVAYSPEIEHKTKVKLGLIDSDITEDDGIPKADNANKEIKKYNRNKVKYVCPSCEAKVWGKTGLHIFCSDCDCDCDFEEENNAI